MIKLIFAALFFLLSLSNGWALSAISNFSSHKIEISDKNKLSEIKKEQVEFHSKLQDLCLKYGNSKSEKEKNDMREEIRVLIYNHVTKELAQKKSLLQAQRARIDDFEKKINEIEKNKDGFVYESVSFFTSPQEIARIQKIEGGALVKKDSVRK